MTDWVVWPIFLIEFIAFGLLAFKNKAFFFNIKPKTLSLFLLLVVCVLIVVSLIHDSTDQLRLFF
jgi:hypothetical protein